jgi:hypothetical protein
MGANYRASNYKADGVKTTKSVEPFRNGSLTKNKTKQKTAFEKS